jgi:hypothetical protein
VCFMTILLYCFPFHSTAALLPLLRGKATFGGPFRLMLPPLPHLPFQRWVLFLLQVN